ncbi:MAG: leucine--tRNA ligase [Gemmatimonadetes bacterium]|nr:leucine--tRNA ligase [Gemmatimonadota bacterium]MBT5056626.1 leucine--tRNA ligase [Gemmatimonadota bacterium]MBT5964060.1 leucine--tRNA ligase [Gemmatimonadota bacterium]MBT7452256.1 leucine--tRNA ligase [Gemmatimonadota bacterium]
MTSSTSDADPQSTHGDTPHSEGSEKAAPRSEKPGYYDYRRIERHWRERWLADKTYRTPTPGEVGFDPQQPKCYILDMFPYPSGDGLHIGHPKGYIASDIYSRYKRMQGFNVLHPMGFDSFGLPAEQYAVEHNVHPSVATEKSIDRYRDQLQFLGMSYDWDREIATSRPDYYEWTQWIFLRLFGHWFDHDHVWSDEAGRNVKGRARSIDELVAEFDAGARELSTMDLRVLEDLSSKTDHSSWQALTEPERQHVVNNYRLAYQQEVTVNWCPGLGTVLANEEVTADGKSERGDFAVYQRPLKQWMLRITAYAERLLGDLDDEVLPDGRGETYRLDWPEATKMMQRNWIGRSEGGEVRFGVLDANGQATASDLLVFTTRPDTLFGATFMVVAPQHPLVSADDASYAVPEHWPEGTDARWKGDDSTLGIRAAVATYVRQAEEARAEKATDRSVVEQDKTGVFSGIWASNPVNGDRIPVFVADYVSMEYGTGAIMAVPAHDDRDHAFATKYGLQIVEVVQAPEVVEEACYTGDGVAINSPASQTDSPFAITGLPTPEAKKKIITALESAGVGRAAVSYRLRDWIFSRQRYWGEPFPLAQHPDGYAVATDLPVTLPEMSDFRPTTSEDPNTPVSSPLSRADQEWSLVDVDGSECRRELNVMPQWAGSCWYYLRYIDPHNETAFCDAEAERFFMPVDLYIGGAEHAVLHLLYARFWHKVLFDIGDVSSPEPFKKLFNQGMITADAFTDARGSYVDIRKVIFEGDQAVHADTKEELKRFRGKMGKRYKNGLPPEEVGDEYGVDTLRLYEMYMGPLEQSAPWSMEGIRGMQRFLQRVWRNFVSEEGEILIGGDVSPAMGKSLHQTIIRVTDDIEGLRFNTAIAGLIELNNSLVKHKRIPRDVARNLVLLLSPLAPHTAEELWTRCGFGDGDLSSQQWPVSDSTMVAEETMTLPVQVNGKVRASIEVPAEISEADLRERVLALENVSRFLPESGEIKRFIIVPGKIVNIVA